MKKNRDPMGTPNLKKVPMGTQVPKWGPRSPNEDPGPQMGTHMGRGKKYLAAEPGIL